MSALDDINAFAARASALEVARHDQALFARENHDKAWAMMQSLAREVVDALSEAGVPPYPILEVVQELRSGLAQFVGLGSHKEPVLQICGQAWHLGPVIISDSNRIFSGFSPASILGRDSIKPHSMSMAEILIAAERMGITSGSRYFDSNDLREREMGLGEMSPISLPAPYTELMVHNIYTDVNSPLRLAVLESAGALLSASRGQRPET